MQAIDQPNIAESVTLHFVDLTIAESATYMATQLSTVSITLHCNYSIMSEDTSIILYIYDTCDNSCYNRE